MLFSSQAVNRNFVFTAASCVASAIFFSKPQDSDQRASSDVDKAQRQRDGPSFSGIRLL
jgi:hypothetical protein